LTTSAVTGAAAGLGTAPLSRPKAGKLVNARVAAVRKVSQPSRLATLILFVRVSSPQMGDVILEEAPGMASLLVVSMFLLRVIFQLLLSLYLASASTSARELPLIV
jgi:hypothetical protein